MSFGFSVGDFLAIGALLATTIRKCRSASSEFEELSQILQTISCCVESARNTLDGIYEGLPIVHQRSVASAMIGLKNLATSLDQELDKYAELVPGEIQLVKLQFALLADPRAAESKLTLHLSMLNTCMGIIIIDSLTKSSLHSYHIPNMAAAVKSQTSTMQGTETAMDSQRRLIPSLARNWITAATSGVLVTKLLSRHFSARGFYDYSELATPKRDVPQLDTVEYKLRISGNRVHGTSADTIGNASIDGFIDFQNDTICFIKQYNGERGYLRWEYDGNFTSCGIVGEWHYPNDPPNRRHHRGKFAVWLLSEEFGQGSQRDTQLRMLKDSGKILTRSMSFRNLEIEA